MGGAIIYEAVSEYINTGFCFSDIDDNGSHKKKQRKLRKPENKKEGNIYMYERMRKEHQSVGKDRWWWVTLSLYFAAKNKKPYYLPLCRTKTLCLSYLLHPFIVVTVI